MTADGCEVWTGTQFQTVDQQRAAKILGLKPDQVKIHTMFLGGGFGRRANAGFRLRGRGGARRQGRRTTSGQGGLDPRGRHARRLLPADVPSTGSRSASTERAARSRWQHTIVGQSILAGTPFAAG